MPALNVTVNLRYRLHRTWIPLVLARLLALTRLARFGWTIPLMRWAWSLVEMEYSIDGKQWIRDRLNLDWSKVIVDVRQKALDNANAS